MHDGFRFDMKDGVTKILSLLPKIGFSLVKENKMLFGDSSLGLDDAS